MQLKTVKTAADLPFKGVELIKVDNSIRGVVIGGKLRVQLGSYSQIEVLVEQPFEKAKRHRVIATLDGFDPKVEHFESSYEADERVRFFEGTGAKVEKTEVQALINDNGEVVGDASDAAAEPVLEDLPF